MNPKWISRFQLKPGAWVFVPSDESVKTGGAIKKIIEERWSPPRNYFHLRNGGHVAAIRSHLKHSSFAHLDIRDFFGSINKTRVTRCLKEYFPYAAARDMANASTVFLPEDKGRNFLPFGFVQSPIIASLCLYQSALGRCLAQLGKMADVAVSVYVDDIIISTDDAALSHLIVSTVKNAAEKARFELNKDKEEGPSGKVTAFNIELSQYSMLIESNRLSEFVESFASSETEHQRRGISGYVASVNAAQSKQLLVIK